MKLTRFWAGVVLLAACSSNVADEATELPPPDVTPADCPTTLTADKLTLGAAATLPTGAEGSYCLRWTAPEDIEISGFEGHLGIGGHHALLFAQSASNEPDGTAPCNEDEIMDTRRAGEFNMLAGVSYESSGKRIEFPSTPVQVGLRVRKGEQLIFDAHFVNADGQELAACSTLTLHRGKPVVAELEFRAVLPEAQYALAIPAGAALDVTYSEPAGERFRIVAASSHMHAGGMAFRMSILERDFTLFETTDWHSPEPRVFGFEKVVVEADEHFLLECSFENDGAVDVVFPDQMCVGGMYTLACGLPGAC